MSWSENNVEAPRRYSRPDTELSSFFGWLDTCSILAVGRLGPVAQSVQYYFGERRSVIVFLSCDGLLRAGPRSTLLMDTKFSFPVRFPFNPSKIRLEDIEVPEVLNLPTLKKV
uniref:Uncharacterized protein n=1 Tax=Timema monikensis TaxID=170555 RepID=A0A7R9EAP5_9NEOP|nr:unnamed protein product [Timema monikensis]